LDEPVGLPRSSFDQDAVDFHQRVKLRESHGVRGAEREDLLVSATGKERGDRTVSSARAPGFRR